MLYGDIPVLKSIVSYEYLSAQRDLEVNSLSIRHWNTDSPVIFETYKTDRREVVNRLKAFFDKVNGIGMLDINFLRNFYLDEEIEIFEREAELRPEFPRNWKLLGLAHFVKGHFDATHYEKSAECYAEFIRRMAKHPKGRAWGLAGGLIGFQTPNRPRMELGLAVGNMGYYEEARYHLLKMDDGSQVAEEIRRVGIENLVKNATKEHQSRQFGRICLEYPKQ